MIVTDILIMIMTVTDIFTKITIAAATNILTRIMIATNIMMTIATAIETAGTRIVMTITGNQEFFRHFIVKTADATMKDKRN